MTAIIGATLVYLYSSGPMHYVGLGSLSLTAVVCTTALFIAGCLYVCANRANKQREEAERHEVENKNREREEVEKEKSRLEEERLREDSERVLQNRELFQQADNQLKKSLEKLGCEKFCKS